MTHRVCLCVQSDRSLATTFTYTHHDRPILLCAYHALRHRNGEGFILYPPKEAK